MLIIYLFLVKREREREKKTLIALIKKTYEDMISLSMSMAQSNPSVIHPFLSGIKCLFTWRWVQK